MHYDPIKKSLGKFFNTTPFLRITFYRLLNLLLLRTWHIKKILKAWAKDKQDNIHILDAGAGFGQYSYFLSCLNPSWKILSVDLKTEQVNDCNIFFNKTGKNNVTFQVADLTQFQMKETMDLILSVDVMEHISEDTEVFKNFFISLKKNGMLLVSTPSNQGGSDVHDEDESSFIEEHVRDGYSVDDIENKLRTAGFTKMESHYTYGTPGKISWKLSMKYPVILLNFSKWFFIVLPLYYLFTFPFSFLLNYLDTVIQHSSGSGLIVRAWK